MMNEILTRSATRVAVRMAARSGQLAAPAGRFLRSRGFQGLAPAPSEAPGTPTSARINRVLERTGGDRYLEVGLKFGATLEAVQARVRVGVEPVPLFNPWPPVKGVVVHVATSDEFFLLASRRRDSFDLVFLDGLHEFRQTYRDLLNAVKRVAPGGFILIDDVVPSSAAAAAPTQAEAKRLREPGDSSREWMGDVFRIMPVVSEAHPELEFRTIIDSDCRPQALVRVLDPESTEAAPERVIGSAAELTYDEVFQHGVPPSFRPSSLDSALRELGS